jgi:hypothetical protein
MIKNLDTTKWQEFDFDKIFLIKRGKRLKTSNQILGNIAYISSTKLNNGIDNYITPPSNMTIYKNSITLNNSGSIGYCFYHTYSFVASDHCTILKLKNNKTNLNLSLFLFLKPIIQTMKSKYGFAREMSNDRLKKEKILLPAIKKENKYIPNWKYMESYIVERSKDIVYNKNIIKPKNSLKLNSTQWQEFKIKDLFDVTGSKTTSKIKLMEYSNGKNPYITTRATNNGVDSFYDYYTEKGNILVVDSATIGHTTYQELDFSASDHVEKLIPKFKLNIYIALFLTTILNKEQYRYNYGRKFNQIRIKETIIKLPATQKNNPNWEFMENYIKSLPYSSNIL